MTVSVGSTLYFDSSIYKYLVDEREINLYAYYRLPTHSVYSYSNGTYSQSSGDSIIVHSLKDDRDFYINADLTFNKGTAAIGIAFYMSITKDNAWEDANNNYLGAQIRPDTGGFRLCRVTGGKSSWSDIGSTALANMPSAWQTKYNAAASEASISASITAISTGSSISFYIDGNLVTTYSNTSVLNAHTGNGYGARNSSAGSTIKLTYNTYSVGRSKLAAPCYDEILIDSTTGNSTTGSFAITEAGNLTAGKFSFVASVAQKPSSEFNVRIMFYGYDSANGVKLNGDGTQKILFMTLNLASGGTIIGTKQCESSGDEYNNLQYQSLESIMPCAFKRYFNGVSVGSPLKVSLKVIFKAGGVKFYVNDCLIAVYGTISYSGETLYGQNLTNASAGHVVATNFNTLINSNNADKVGVGVWNSLSLVGALTITDIKVSAYTPA